MAERTLPGLGLTGFWDLGANNWKAGMDLNLRKLSLLVQLSVLSMTTALPSTGLADGMIYIIPSGGDAKKIAIYDESAWVYFTPAEGWLAYVKDTDKYVKFDGTNWVDLTTGGGGGTAAMEYACYIAGKPAAAEIVMRHVMTQAGTIPIGMTGSRAVLNVATTAAKSFDLKKNTTAIGTINFAAGAVVGTFTFTAAVAFAAGDILQLSAPAAQDATLADLSVSIVMG